MVTAVRMDAGERDAAVTAGSAAAVSLAAVQRGRGDANIAYSRLFATLGLPVQVPGFEHRWDYSRFLADTLHQASGRSRLLVGTRAVVGVDASPTLAGFLPRFALEMNNATNN